MAALPGDGAWLVQSATHSRRRPKQFKTFLLPEADLAYKGAPESQTVSQPYQSLLLGNHEAYKRQEPIVGSTSINLTSSAEPSTPSSKFDSLRLDSGNPALDKATQLLTFLRQRSVYPSPASSARQLNGTLDSSPPSQDTAPESVVAQPKLSDEMSAQSTPSPTSVQQEVPATRTKVLPPHLRKKTRPVAVPITKPTPDTEETRQASGSKNDSVVSPIRPEMDHIRAKLESDHGVKVFDAQPAPNAGKRATPAASSRGKSQNASQQPKRGGTRNAKRVEPSQSGSRNKKWPTTKEQRPDPKRWEINWDSASEKETAISGWTSVAGRPAKDGEGAKLTDWSGNWAPPPVDWDSRPGFRDNQSSTQIEKWIDRVEDNIPTPKSADRSIDRADLEHDLAGDFAPRYWIPQLLNNIPREEFWVQLLRPSDEDKRAAPKYICADPEDLNGAIPWWRYYQNGTAVLRPYQAPVVTGIDPDENPDERIARENDAGSQNHTENRKAVERAKKEAELEKKRLQKEKARKARKTIRELEAQRYKPGLDIYIRGAIATDVPALRNIYNHYVTYSVATPEIEPVSEADFRKRYNDIRRQKLPFLVACQRGEKLNGGRGGRSRRVIQDPIILPDKIVGFTFAKDFNEMNDMYRFTVIVELYVDNQSLLKGVGKCLLDKMLGLMDPDHLEFGGYDIQGDEAEGVGASRLVKNILVNVSYEQLETLAWKARWLKSVGFEQRLDLEELGRKNEKTMNLAIFQHTTATRITSLSNLPSSNKVCEITAGMAPLTTKFIT